MKLEDIIDIYRSDEFISQERLEQFRRYLIGIQYDLTIDYLQGCKDVDEFIYNRGFKDTGARVSYNAAESDANYKFPQKRIAQQLLEVVRSTLISIQNELKRE